MPLDAYGNPLPVASLDDIESVWGNASQARLQLTYPTSAARNAAIPTPHVGQRVWIDENQAYTVWTGSAWVVDIASIQAAVRFFDNPAVSVFTPAGNPGPWTAIDTGAQPWTKPAHWNQYGFYARWYVAGATNGAASGAGRMRVDGGSWSTVLEGVSGQGPHPLMVSQQATGLTNATPSFDLEGRTTQSTASAAWGYRDARLDLLFFRTL